jgi:hypothetical protein
VSEANFTPGPWHWHNCGSYFVLTNDVETPDGEYCNGYVHTDGSAAGEYAPDIDVDGANGKLIAAAPELYAALEAALPLLKRDAEYWLWQMPFEPEATKARRDIERYKNAVAALAKARGEVTP